MHGTNHQNGNKVQTSIFSAGNSQYTGTLQYLAKHPFPPVFQNGLHAISLFGYHEWCLTIVTAVSAYLNEELTSCAHTYSFLL